MLTAGWLAYVIILLGLGGVALASERIYVLRNTLTDIKEQEGSKTVDSENLLNVIQTANENINESLDSLELILDEKIQSITPTIEVGKSYKTYSYCCSFIWGY